MPETCERCLANAAALTEAKRRIASLENDVLRCENDVLRWMANDRKIIATAMLQALVTRRPNDDADDARIAVGMADALLDELAKETT